MYGPYVLPSTVSDQRGAAAATPGGGGGAVVPGAGGGAPAPATCWKAPPIAPPIARPAPRPAPAPAMPPGLAAAVLIASADWSCVYCPRRSPRTPSFVRWSIAASTSSGSETFSMKNFDSSRPNAANSGPRICLPCPDSSSYFEARSSAAIFDSAMASESFERIVERSCPVISSCVVRPRVPTTVREEGLRVGDLHRVRPEGTQPDHPELRVAHHDGVRRPPLQVGEEARVEEVDVRLEGGLEAVLPAAKIRQDREVLGRQLVAARREEVRRLPLVDEERRLVLANRQLRVHLDLLVVDGEPVDHRVVRVVEPRDDLDEL